MGLSGTALTEVNAYTAQVFPPAPGTFALAEDVAAGEQVFANRTNFLNINKLNKNMVSGDTLDVQTGAIVTVHAGGTVNFNADSTLSCGGSADFSGETTLQGTVIHDGEDDLHFVGATRLAWADVTLNNTHAQRLVIGAVGPSGTPVVIKLKDTAGSTLPADGWWFEITVAMTSTVSAQTVTIQRESASGTYLARLTIPTITGSNRSMLTFKVIKDHALGLWVMEAAPGDNSLVSYGADAF